MSDGALDFKQHIESGSTAIVLVEVQAAHKLVAIYTFSLAA